MTKEKKTSTLNFNLRVTEKKKKLFERKAFAKELDRISKTMTGKPYNRSRLYGRFVNKLMSEPKKVLEFFDYDAD